MSQPDPALLSVARGLVPDDDRENRLRGALNQGLQFNPDEYAKAMRVTAKTGVIPSAVLRDPKPFQQASLIDSVNPAAFVNVSPRTASWLVNEVDNAALAHDDLQNLSNLENHVGTIRAMTPGEARYYRYVDPVMRKAQSYPLSRAAIGLVGGTAGFFGNVGSFLGWHGDNGRNTLQNIQHRLDPAVTGADTVLQSQHLPFDTLSQEVAPLIPAGFVSGGTTAVMRLLGASQKVSAVASGLGMGLAFTADQGGYTYTNEVLSGKTPGQARAAANKVALITAPANMAFGLTPMVRQLHENPFASSLVMGGVQGLSNQIASNTISGRPWHEGIPASMIRAAAFQGGMHAGFEVMGGINQMAQLAGESKLRERAPEKFREVVKEITDGSPVENVLVPAEAWQTYWQEQGADPARAAEASGAKNYLEALAAGTDVVIPMADYLTTLAPDHHEGLKADLRLQPGGFTAREMEAYQKEAGQVEAQVKAEGEQAMKDVAADPAFQAIKEDTLRQLVAAGDSPDVAETRAAIHAQALVTMAGRAGMDPMTLQKAYGLTISRPLPGESGSLVDKVLGRLAAQGKGQEGTLFQTEEPPKGVHFNDLPKEHQARVVAGIEADIQHWAAHPEEFHAAYEADPETFGGRLVNGDIMRRLLPTVAKNVPLGLEAGNHTDLAIETLMMPLYRERVTRAIDMAMADGKPVGITAAGQSSGKTKFAERILGRERMGAVIDAPHDDFKSISKIVDQVLQRGGDAVIYFVDRPNFFEAYKSMLRRAIREGRPVELSDMAAKHVAVPAEVLKTGEAYRNQPRVHLVHVLSPEGADFEVLAGGPMSDEGKDAVSSIRNRTSQTRDSLEAQGKAAYLDYANGVRNGSEQPLPPDLQRFFSGSGDVQVPAEPGVQGRHEAGDPGRPGQAPDLQPGTQAGYDRLKAGLQDLGISPDADIGEIKRQLTEASQDPANAEKVQAVVQALRDVGGQEFFQSRYASASEARRARMKKLAGNTQAAFDRARAEDHQSQEDAFQAWDAEVRNLVAGDIHAATGDKQGFIQFGPDRQMHIGFLEKANLSTFTHETGHMYVEILHDLAAREDAPAQVKEDLAKLRAFAGAEGDAPLTTAQHEKLARANEAYLMEGKAPSEALRSAFQRVKFWMMTVYRNLTGLGVKLNEDVRGVFDRIYASDAEIEQARQEVGGDQPLFTSPEDLGATQAEFDIYVKKSTKAIAAAKDALAGRLVKEMTRERESWWKEESSKVREEVTAEVDGDAVYQGFKALADGKLEDGTPIKLSKDALIDRYGKDVVKDLPRSFQRLYSREGGMDAEAAAEFLGFRNGDALVEGLKTMEPRRERIERLTQERMKATHGDLLAPENIATAAQEALHSDLQGEVKLEELRALRRRQRQEKPAEDLKAAKEQGKVSAQAARAEGAAAVADLKGQAASEAMWRRGVVAEVPPLETFKKAAVDLIESQQTKDLEPHRYLVGQRTSSRKAFEALAKGDFAGAADAKQQELLNHFLYREAVKAQEEVQSAYAFAKRFGKATVRERIAKAGGEQGQTVYLDQIDNLLERFEFARVSNKALDQRQSLVAFAVEQAAGGEMLVLDPMIYSDQPRNYRELTLPELRAVRDALKNLETVARRQYEFLTEGKQVTFDQARAEMANAAYGNNKTRPLPLDPEARTRVDKAVSVAKKISSELLKMEEIVDRLDGGDINGPWRRYVFEPMAEAQFKEHELNQSVTAKLAEAMEAMPKDQRLSMGDQFDIEGLGTVSRKFILSMALNMGNESNKAKMFKGMGWASPDKMEAVGRALDKLNRSDWEFAQKTWDALGSLWPEIEAQELRFRGVAPERVEVQPFTVTLADGSTMNLEGGYYPIAWDPSRSTAGARQADVEIMNSEGGFSGPSTSQGHTKSRVEAAAYPMLMDFEQVLSRHVARVVKDISHREPAIAAAKLIRNQDVRAAVQKTLGPEYEAQMLPWLKGTVNDVAAMNPELGRWMLQARSNMVIAGLAFRASSVIVQVTDIGRVMVGEHAVKGRYLAEGLALLSRDLAKATLKADGSQFETIAKIRELSPEMASRAENLDRDTRAMLHRLQGKDTFTAKAQKAGMAGLAIADEITSYTSWWGAYKQALAEGHSETEAARMGDRVVRLKLQAGAAKDLTALQRDGSWGTKLITTYMGDAVATFGMMSRSAHEAGQGRNYGRSAAAAILAGMIIPMLGDLIKNRGPQDDQDKLAWGAKQMAWSLPSSIPIARDVAMAFQNGMDYKFTPLANAINKPGKLVKMLSDDKEHDWEDWFLNGLDSVGTLGGLPGTSQLMTSGRYLRKVQKGQEQFNPVDAVLGSTPKQQGGR